jgi:hypothetical protein
MKHCLDQAVGGALMAACLVLAPSHGHASLSCPTPQPAFSYIDVDNDGCHTAGIDSESVDDQLQASPTMANTPSFVGPPDTGLVIPHEFGLPDDADPFWSVPNDVWIDGAIRGPSSVRIEAGGTTYVNGPIRIKAKGHSDEGDLRLGCAAGCGPTVVADGVRITNNGLLSIYGAEVGDDVNVKVSCVPGHIPCGGSAYFARATAIGQGFRVNSPGGIHFESGTSLLTIGDGASLATKAVRIDGGTVGFSIRFELDGGVAFGAGTRLRAGGSATLRGGDGGPLVGPVSLGAGAEIAGSGISLGGSSVDIGANSRLRATRDISGFGPQLSSIGVGAAAGALTIGDGSVLVGGRISLGAAAGLLDVGNGVQLTTSGADQEIELAGSDVVVGAGATLSKSTGDLTPILITATSSVVVASSSLKGAGLDVSVSDPGASIAFTDDAVIGASGTAATFTAPSGTCDLTGSTFTKLAVDTAACGAVIDP